MAGNSSTGKIGLKHIFVVFLFHRPQLSIGLQSCHETVCNIQHKEAACFRFQTLELLLIPLFHERCDGFCGWRAVRVEIPTIQQQSPMATAFAGVLQIQDVQVVGFRFTELIVTEDTAKADLALFIGKVCSELEIACAPQDNAFMERGFLCGRPTVVL